MDSSFVHRSFQMDVEEESMGSLVFENEAMMCTNLFDDSFLVKPPEHVSLGINQPSSNNCPNFNYTNSPITSSIEDTTMINNCDYSNNKNKNVMEISFTREDPWMMPQIDGTNTGHYNHTGNTRLSSYNYNTMIGSFPEEVGGQQLISFSSSSIQFGEDPVYNFGGQHPHVPCQDYPLDSSYGSSFQYPSSCSENGASNAVKKATQEHILSERRRRQKLAQKFLQLTAVLPNLSKVDKASVLEQAIKHISQLQHRIKLLHGKQTREDEISSSEDADYFKANPSQLQHPFLEILARSRDRSILIRVIAVDVDNHNDDDLTSKLLNHIDKLNLTQIRSNAMPFGTSKIVMIFSAEMNDDFHITLKDLVKNLQSAL